MLRLRVTAGAVGETVRLSLSATWSDPVADTRRTLDVTPLPIALAEPAVVATASADPLVAEQAALQIATAERREALLLDRAAATPNPAPGWPTPACGPRQALMSAEIAEDLAISMHLAAAPTAALQRARPQAVHLVELPPQPRQTRLKLSAVSHQPSAISHQLSAISYQLSAISYRLLVGVIALTLPEG